MNINRSNAIKKRWENPEFRQRMSDIHKGQKPWNTGKKRPPFSDTWRKNMSKPAWNKGLLGYHAGEENPNWKGGKTIDAYGYIFIYAPGHPYAHRNYVKEHRLVMEKSLNRYLDPKEIVHHINGIKYDNRIENLEIMTQKKHAFLHGKKNNNLHSKILNNN